ncbi:MAG: hypothetical protein WKF45_05610 [Ilumatobacteraceae bacterium]
MSITVCCGALIACGADEKAETTDNSALATAPTASPATSQPLAVTSAPDGGDDIWSTVRIAEAFDSGSTYEGGGNQYSVAEEIGLEDVVADAQYAIRGRVIDIHPSEVNTRTGEFEISDEQRASDAPPAVTPEARTKIDVEVLDVLGERPDSPVSPGNEVRLDAAGGSLRLVMVAEAAAAMRLIDTDTTLPPGDVEATIGQNMELGWSEGDEVIVFVTQRDVLLSTFTNGKPDVRPDATTIAAWPAGAFAVVDDMAISRAEYTSFGSRLPVEDIIGAAEELNQPR